MTLAVAACSLIGSFCGVADADATRLSIRDAAALEGNGGTTSMKFKVRRTGARGMATVRYKTIDRTANAPGDYRAKSGVLRFPRDRKIRRIRISVVGDTAVEPDETLRVKLRRPANARIADRRATGTIVGDDASETPGCFDDAQAALEGDSSGDLSSNACAQGEGGDAQPSCETGAGRHQWWSFEVPGGETATFTVSPATGDDIGVALFTANSGASELECKDNFGPGSAETTALTNQSASTFRVYVQIFALLDHEGPYTLNVESLNCFADAQVALEGDNLGDLSSNACPRGAGDAQPSCETGGGRHQWWSFEVPGGETATFTVSPATGDDIGVALFTANSGASELECKDNFGPGSAETTTLTNESASTFTVYVQIFALLGHEGPYTLNVESETPP